MEKNSKIGDSLYKLRRERHLSQEEMASALNMKLTTYRSIETGRTKGRIDTLINISKYFGVSLDYLVYGDKNRQNEILDLLSELDINTQDIICKILKAAINELK